jgi:hypothetical protein
MLAALVSSTFVRLTAIHLSSSTRFTVAVNKVSEKRRAWSECVTGGNFTSEAIEFGCHVRLLTERHSHSLQEALKLVKKFISLRWNYSFQRSFASHRKSFRCQFVFLLSSICALEDCRARFIDESTPSRAWRWWIIQLEAIRMMSARKSITYDWVGWANWFLSELKTFLCAD